MGFKQYQKFVENCAKKHGKGWHIEIDPVAKYPGEYFIDYSYIVFKKIDGKRFVMPSLPPFQVANYSRNDDFFDNRVQLYEETIIGWLDRLEESFNKAL